MTAQAKILCGTCKKQIRTFPSDQAQRLKRSKSGHLFCGRDCASEYFRQKEALKKSP